MDLNDPVIRRNTVGRFSFWGCAFSSSLRADGLESEEGREVELSSSAISMMASPRKVSVSVFVGDLGD